MDKPEQTNRQKKINLKLKEIRQKIIAETVQIVQSKTKL